MLALLFFWMFLTAILSAITILPTWACAMAAAIPCGIWLYKRPEDF